MIKKQNNQPIQRKMKAKNYIKSKFIDQQTGSDTPKKTSFKLKFIQWLKQLPLDQRYLAVKVYAPGLSKKIQETLIDIENEQIQQIKKDPQIAKKITGKQSKQIIESIVLISDGQQYFDSIGFDFTYIEHPDKLYQLLSYTLSQSQKQMYMSEQYQIQLDQLKDSINHVQKCHTKQQLAYFLISFLRGQIFIKFQQKRSINLEQERNRKKQFSMFWRCLSQENKKKILLLNKQDSLSLSKFLAQKKIYIESQSIEKQIIELLQLDKNEFCNRIFKCKLKRSLTYYTDYHQLVYKAWKSQLNRKKRKQRNYRNNKEQKGQTSLNRKNENQIGEKLSKRPIKQQQKIQTIEKGGQNIGRINNNNSSGQNGNVGTGKRKRNRNHNNRRKKSVSAQSKQTKATNYKSNEEEAQKQKEKNENYSTCSITSKQEIEDLSEIKRAKSIQNCTLETVLNKIDTLKNPLKEVQEQALTLPIIDYQQQIYNKLYCDIQQYSDLINQEANQFYQRRVIAYERIQFVLNLWNIPIKLFGSCASGITIKNSDIDIAVDNSILNYFITLPQTHRLKAALQHLQLFLQQQPCVTSLKLIKTAAIPLIKMKLDTSIKFIQIPGFQIPFQYIQSLNRQHISQGQIHIDLTIETFNKQQQCDHLGIISTDQINKWLKQIKPLHSIIIIIKNYLTKMNLNITYEGGLNTYSMICMIVAYLKQNKLQQEAQIAPVLEKILKFYVYQFDEKFQGIDLLNQKQIFYDKLSLKSTKSQLSSQQKLTLPQLSSSKSLSLCKADLQIKDPLNNGKIMTKNCYSFPKIKQVFNQIYQVCFIQTKIKLQKCLQEQFILRAKEFIQFKQNSQQMERRTKQLIKQCKIKLSNPFLTLFE